MGWKIEDDWDTLSEWERFEWLSEDYRRQELIDIILEPFNERSANGEGVDTTAYWILQLAKI